MQSYTCVLNPITVPKPTQIYQTGKKCKHEKRKLKRNKQLAEDDLDRQIEERFQILNECLCEGLLNQEMLVELRREAILNNNSIDEQVLDVLIH